MRHAIWLFAVVLARAETPSAIAIEGARVATAAGPVLERATVVLRDGLIEAVGENVALPPDAWVIPGKGLTVYPGLVDALSGLGLPQAESAAPARGPAAPAASPPPPRARGPEDRPFTQSWLRAADQVNAADSRIAEARNAGFTSAVVFPTGGIFAGQGARINLAGEKRRLIVEAPAGQYVSFTDRAFAAYPASLMGAIAYVRQVYLDAAHYQLHKQAYEREAGLKRPDYDRALEGVLESPRLLLPARNAAELDRMVRFAGELKAPAVLYGGHEAYQAAERIAKAGIPVLISLRWPERPREADPDDVEPLRVLELRERAPSSPAALAKAGARFAFYSDGTPLRDMRKAVKKAIDAGLSRADALRALTLGAAEIYRLDRRVGSIEKGKIANLVVTDGDLFEEKTRLKFIFIDGVKFEPVEVQPAPEAKS